MSAKCQEWIRNSFDTFNWFRNKKNETHQPAIWGWGNLSTIADATNCFWFIAKKLWRECVHPANKANCVRTSNIVNNLLASCGCTKDRRTLLTINYQGYTYGLLNNHFFDKLLANKLPIFCLLNLLLPNTLQFYWI